MGGGTGGKEIRGLYYDRLGRSGKGYLYDVLKKEQSATMPTDSLAWDQNAIEGLQCQRA